MVTPCPPFGSFAGGRSAVVGLDDLGHGHAKAVVDDHHFAARDQSVVGVQIDGFAHHAVQLHHGAAAQLQELAHLHGRRAQNRRNLNRNVVDRVRVAGLAGGSIVPFPGGCVPFGRGGRSLVPFPGGGVPFGRGGRSLVPAPGG